jgi:hypothetical protein
MTSPCLFDVVRLLSLASEKGQFSSKQKTVAFEAKPKKTEIQFLFFWKAHFPDRLTTLHLLFISCFISTSSVFILAWLGGTQGDQMSLKEFAQNIAKPGQNVKTNTQLLPWKKVAPKLVLLLYFSKKSGQSKQSLNSRKFAQSGHPGAASCFESIFSIALQKKMCLRVFCTYIQLLCT